MEFLDSTIEVEQKFLFYRNPNKLNFICSLACVRNNNEYLTQFFGGRREGMYVNLKTKYIARKLLSDVVETSGASYLARANPTSSAKKRRVLVKLKGYTD